MCKAICLWRGRTCALIQLSAMWSKKHSGVPQNCQLCLCQKWCPNFLSYRCIPIYICMYIYMDKDIYIYMYIYIYTYTFIYDILSMERNILSIPERDTSKALQIKVLNCNGHIYIYIYMHICVFSFF